jgi:transposase InsO family protein
MRAAPYGPCLPSSCVICGWKVVDDYSRYAWVFFLEDKGETIGFVRDLVLRFRNKRREDAVQAICSDNGLEFKNSHFETFCHALGLEHQFSSPYTPPYNGVVERKNRTLCEMAQTMLDEHRTPRRFCVEASVQCATCRTGSTSEFTRRKPVTSWCRVAHPRWVTSMSLVVNASFLRKGRSYASYFRALHVLNLETNQIVETCEVTFD